MYVFGARRAAPSSTAPRLRRTQPRVARTNDGLRPACHLQLAKDVGDVIAHGLAAQHKLFGNRGVGVALRDEGQDLALTLGQLWERLRRGRSLRRVTSLNAFLNCTLMSLPRFFLDRRWPCSAVCATVPDPDARPPAAKCRFLPRCFRRASQCGWWPSLPGAGRA